MRRKMKNKYLKVLTPSVAEELAALGFSYTTEQINKRVVFTFFADNDLLSVVLKKYTTAEYVWDDHMYF